MAFNSLGYKEAIDNYEKAIPLNPQYVDVFIALGSTHSNNKRYKGCIHNFEQVLKIDRHHKVSIHLRDRCISALNHRQFKECATGYEKALVIKPLEKEVIKKIDKCMSLIERQQ